MNIKFSVRNTRKKKQVRFWGNQETYVIFAKAVKKNNLFITDVFEEFMLWFIKASKEDRLKVSVNKNGD